VAHQLQPSIGHIRPHEVLCQARLDSAAERWHSCGIILEHASVLSRAATIVTVMCGTGATKMCGALPGNRVSSARMFCFSIPICFKVRACLLSSCSQTLFPVACSPDCLGSDMRVAYSWHAACCASQCQQVNPWDRTWESKAHLVSCCEVVILSGCITVMTGGGALG